MMNRTREEGSVPAGLKPDLMPMLWFLGGGIAKLSWRALKRPVRRALGRPQFRDEQSRFLVQAILHLTGIRPIKAITCMRHNGQEGAGSQAHLLINAISFARLAGLTYVHTPFQTIHHADRPMAEWLALWESFFNLGEGELASTDWDGDLVNYCYNWPELEFCMGLDKRRDAQIAAFGAILPEIRARYRRGKFYKPRQPGSGVIVAAHVRRGDIDAASGGSRFISTQSILTAIASISSILEALGVEHMVHIHSQGDRADFAEFSARGMELHLDADPAQTLQQLIAADVLIMDHGFFSLYAALVSAGVKVSFGETQASPRAGAPFLPSWYWPDRLSSDDWICCDLQGAMDYDAAACRILDRLQTTRRPDQRQGN